MSQRSEDLGDFLIVWGELVEKTLKASQIRDCLGKWEVLDAIDDVVGYAISAFIDDETTELNFLLHKHHFFGIKANVLGPQRRKNASTLRQ